LTDFSSFEQAGWAVKAAGDACGAASERGAVPVGIDLTPAMIALARQRHPGLDFRVGSASGPFPGGPFGAVIGHFLVHHLSSPDDVVRG
jgi:SAM-dependent methyltransferase